MQSTQPNGFQAAAMGAGTAITAFYYLPKEMDFPKV
jgi:hypothetical protein